MPKSDRVEKTKKAFLRPVLDFEALNQIIVIYYTCLLSDYKNVAEHKQKVNSLLKSFWSSRSKCVMYNGNSDK